MRALIALLLSVGCAFAQDLPATYDVTGVASDDVLNVRSAPGASYDQIGALPFDAEGVEVIRIRDGWMLVNAEERAGWVSGRFMTSTGAAPWADLSTPLNCFGTEPFWSADITPRAPSAMQTPDWAMIPMTPIWEGMVRDDMETGAPYVSMMHDTPDGAAITTLRGALCSDGMSDRLFGIKITMIFPRAESTQALYGCCSIAR